MILGVNRPHDFKARLATATQIKTLMFAFMNKEEQEAVNKMVNNCGMEIIKTHNSGGRGCHEMISELEQYLITFYDSKLGTRLKQTTRLT